MPEEEASSAEAAVVLVAGPASADLAASIAENMGARLVQAELRVFSDGESKIRMRHHQQQQQQQQQGDSGAVLAGGKSCVIVQSTYPPVDSHLMQALMMARKCADDSAADVCAVIPYLAYARQDRAFLEGEVVSVALVARLLEAAGVKHVITVDIHSKLAMSHFSPPIGIQNISSIPLLAEYARSRLELEKPIVVSPDAGGAERASEFAGLVGTDMIALKKTRDRNTGQVFVDESLDRPVAGRDVLLVDDMISSGGSIIKAAQALRKNGAGRIYAMCAHALLVDGAAQKIADAGVHDIIATNSIPGPHARVDLSPAVTAALRSRFSRSFPPRSTAPSPD